MAKTLILALQLADIEYQTGHKRPKSKIGFFYFKHLFVLLFKLVSIIEQYDVSTDNQLFFFNFGVISRFSLICQKLELLCFNILSRVPLCPSVCR